MCLKSQCGYFDWECINLSELVLFMILVNLLETFGHHKTSSGGGSSCSNTCKQTLLWKIGVFNNQLLLSLPMCVVYRMSENRPKKISVTSSLRQS